jgi:hypothetical protein
MKLFKRNEDDLHDRSPEEWNARRIDGLEILDWDGPIHELRHWPMSVEDFLDLRTQCTCILSKGKGGECNDRNSHKPHVLARLWWPWGLVRPHRDDASDLMVDTHRDGPSGVLTQRVGANRPASYFRKSGGDKKGKTRI